MHTDDYLNIPINRRQGSPKGMKVPEGYFQEFEAQMLLKIQVEKTFNNQDIAIRSTPNYNSWITKVAIAASLVIGLFVLTTNTFVQVESTEFAMDVSDELYDYEIDEYLFADNFSLEDLEAISFNEEYVSSDELMEYILNENYSEYTIIENL